MAIIGMILIDVRGTFELDEKNVTLEWIVLSDDIADFPKSIARQGSLPPDGSMIKNGIAQGWFSPGLPYRLGNDYWETCYAGPLDVTDRKIIRGKGDWDIVGITILPILNTEPLIRYNVRQQYSTQHAKESPETGNPTIGDRATIDVSFDWEEVPFTHDILTGMPVLNSAGQPFNPPAIRRRKIPVYSITRREIWNPLAKCKAYSNTVNYEVYCGALPGTLLMDSIVPKYDGQAWRVTYNIKEREEGWETYLLDTGYYERLPNALIPITEVDGTPLYEPAKLNGFGRRIVDQALPGVNVGPYHKYPQRLFGLLQLPNPFTIDTVR